MRQPTKTPSLTEARHCALRPAYRWSVFPSPPWLSSRSNNEEATALAAAHANMAPYPQSPSLFCTTPSSMASPSSHVPWQVGSRRCVSHPTIFRRLPVPRPPTWLDCEGRPDPDTWRPSCVWLPAAGPPILARCSSSWFSHLHGVHTPKWCPLPTGHRHAEEVRQPPPPPICARRSLEHPNPCP